MSDVAHFASLSLSPQSFNAPPRSKMKLWKGATFAFMLCAAALSTILIRNMATIRQFKLNTKYPSSPSSRPSALLESASKTSPPSSSSPSSESRPVPQQMGDLHRRKRSTDDMKSFLSEFTMMLQSFTEGELQHMVGTVLETKRRKSRRLAKTQGRRTKRARKPKLCTVRTLEVKVNELGLEYKSEETVRLRYCSGKCDKHRENYDMVMKHMMTVGFREKGRRDKVSIQPCCRPTAFEDFTVLDTTVNPSRYRNIHNVSAKNCGCV
ncbi:neurturin isoform X1 [Simochromis diagramma]|uniref:neurturin isoform X1 n=2 Tax=Simochromis diagramma TaxID=43689 RepID=UPI001A7F0359|nr:neurturin isoform X1 [Simochromis diagramma]